MSKVRLIFKNISFVVGSDEIGLLSLVNEEETRQLIIPCDKEMVYQFQLRINHVPIKDSLLPETLWEVLTTQTDINLEIFINGIIEGKYRAILYNTKTFDTVSIRVSDAVLLSYISKIPIYIDELLMEKQSVKYEKESNGVSIPLNAMSMELLNSALSKAIAEEKYELASHLCDEIRRRK
jgi:bifunctional DNase/RNase